MFLDRRMNAYELSRYDESYYIEYQPYKEWEANIYSS